MYKLLALILLAPNIALAQNPLDSLNTAAQGTALIQDKSVPQVIALVIQALISFLGLIFVVLIILGGFRWMTAGGSADKIKEARQLIVNSTIGLVIVLTSYIIVNFVISELMGINQGGSSGDDVIIDGPPPPP